MDTGIEKVEDTSLVESLKTRARLILLGSFLSAAILTSLVWITVS